MKTDQDALVQSLKDELYGRMSEGERVVARFCPTDEDLVDKVHRALLRRRDHDGLLSRMKNENHSAQVEYQAWPS